MTEVSSEFDEDDTPTGLERPGGEIKNYVYGGRIYFEVKDGIFFGGDYSLSKSKFILNSTEDLVNTTKAAGTGLTDRFDGTHIALISGKTMKDFYTWVGFGVSTFVDDNGGSRTNIGDEYSGTFYMVGAGYHLFKSIKLSFEYRRHDLSSFKNATTGVDTDLPDTALGKGKLDVKELLFSISFPIIFGKKSK